VGSITTPPLSLDQRQNYKDDFNSEYDEYRVLHARVESTTRRFTQLDGQCKKLVPGTKEHQVSAQPSAVWSAGVIQSCVRYDLLCEFTWHYTQSAHHLLPRIHPFMHAFIRDGRVRNARHSRVVRS
jgi:hypothetical protein